ncbi:MAG: hypothetical protein U0Q12_09425 [Vicinamibacterales bacterium]
MADPLSPPPATMLAPDTGPERARTIEHLLLSGFDHYFASRYEQAIHVWTRVLFLDRHHERARDYIERARAAIAESQRRSEALLQDGLDAFADGRTSEARRLLRSAVSRGTGDDVALALLSRLDRLDATAPPSTAMVWPPVAASTDAPRVPRGVALTRTPQFWLTAVSLVLLAVAAYVVTAGESVRSWVLSPVDASQEADVRPATMPLVVPDAAELYVQRARALYARGRIDEALRALDNLREEDAVKREADALRAEMQAVLLGARER